MRPAAFPRGRRNLPAHFQIADVSRLARAVPNEPRTGVIKAWQRVRFLQTELQRRGIAAQPREQKPRREMIIHRGKIPRLRAGMDQHRVLGRHQFQRFVVPGRCEFSHGLRNAQVSHRLPRDRFPLRSRTRQPIARNLRIRRMQRRESPDHRIECLHAGRLCRAGALVEEELDGLSVGSVRQDHVAGRPQVKQRPCEQRPPSIKHRAPPVAVADKRAQNKAVVRSRENKFLPLRRQFGSRGFRHQRHLRCLASVQRGQRSQQQGGKENGRGRAHRADLAFAAVGFGAGTCDRSTICLAASSF